MPSACMPPFRMEFHLQKQSWFMETISLSVVYPASPLSGSVEVGEFSFIVEPHPASEGFIGFAPDVEGSRDIGGQSGGKPLVEVRMGGNVLFELNSQKCGRRTGSEAEIGGDFGDKGMIAIEALLDLFRINGDIIGDGAFAATFDGQDGESGKPVAGFDLCQEGLEAFGIENGGLIAGSVADEGEGPVFVEGGDYEEFVFEKLDADAFGIVREERGNGGGLKAEDFFAEGGIAVENASDGGKVGHFEEEVEAQLGDAHAGEDERFIGGVFVDAEEEFEVEACVFGERLLAKEDVDAERFPVDAGFDAQLEDEFDEGGFSNEGDLFVAGGELPDEGDGHVGPDADLTDGAKPRGDLNAHGEAVDQEGGFGFCLDEVIHRTVELGGFGISTFCTVDAEGELAGMSGAGEDSGGVDDVSVPTELLDGKGAERGFFIENGNGAGKIIQGADLCGIDVVMPEDFLIGGDFRGGAPEGGERFVLEYHGRRTPKRRKVFIVFLSDKTGIPSR